MQAAQSPGGGGNQRRGGLGQSQLHSLDSQISRRNELNFTKKVFNDFHLIHEYMHINKYSFMNNINKKTYKYINNK